MVNCFVKNKWHDLPLLVDEFASCRVDQESVGVMLCVFFNFHKYVYICIYIYIYIYIYKYLYIYIIIYILIHIYLNTYINR